MRKKMQLAPIAGIGFVLAASCAASGAVVSNLPATLLAGTGDYGDFAPAGGSKNPQKSALHDLDLATVDTYLNLPRGTGLGYDFVGQVALNSFDLSQSTSGGTRKHIGTARVFYSGGFEDIALADVDTQTVNLSGTVNTSYLFFKPLTVQGLSGFNDPAITEFTVSAPGPIFPRTNYLAGLGGGSISKVGWTNSFGNVSDTVLGDGVMSFDELYDSGIQPASVWLNFVPDTTGTDNYIQYDMGQSQTVSTLGFEQQLGSAQGNYDRKTFTSVRLLLSDDPTFTLGVSTFNFALEANVGYWQLDFAPTTARYARFIALDTEAAGTDNFKGILEVQLYGLANVPEPSLAAAAIIGGLGLITSRRRRI